MNMSEVLDLAIKQKEKGTLDGAYEIIQKGKTIRKSTYMTNGEWGEFLSHMSQDARREFEKADGDALCEKNGRPPKMASYGSSARMLYRLSCQKEGIHYGKTLSTPVGGKAILDGFCEDGDRYIFVQAMCREPYAKKNVSVSKSYEALYAFINGQMAGSLEIGMKPSKCGRYLDVEFFSEGERLERFDLKRTIGYLLGIATGMLQGTLERKQSDLICLLYDPTELDMDPVAKSEIEAIYERACYECNLVDFAALYRAVLTFLAENESLAAVTEEALEELIYSFTFTLASQDFFPILIG